jgi:hypothetical protein
MQRLPVSFGVDSYCLQPHFPAGSNNADGDFAAVGDENFVEHRYCFVFSIL